jgi:hypothetical protein
VDSLKTRCISSATCIVPLMLTRVGMRSCPWPTGYLLPPIYSCAGSLALFRGGRVAAESLCAFRLCFSRELATCEHTRGLFFPTRAAQTGVDEYWCAIRSGVGGVRLAYLKAGPRSDHGTMDNALYICLQTKYGRVLPSKVLSFSYSWGLEGCHALLCEAEVSVCQCSESNMSSPASIAREVLIGVVMTARYTRVGSFAGAHNHCKFFSVVYGGGVVVADVLTRALADFS